MTTAADWTPPRTADEIRRALRASGSKSAAAAALGVSRPTLDRWIRHYSIEVRTTLVV